MASIVKHVFASPVDLLKKATASSRREDAITRLVAGLRSKATAKGCSAGVDYPPYDPRIFAELLGASKTRPADLSVGGRIVFEGDKMAVEYKRGSGSTERSRFTIAHEVAHLALWEVEKNLVPDAKPRRARSQVVERLCDEIATELLAPREEIIGNWKAFSASALSTGKSPDSLQMIQHLAEEFAISLQMAAIRFVEICKPRAGVGLLDLEKKVFVWCHFVPGRYGLLEYLLQQHGDYKRLLEVKSDTGKARIFSGSATYPLLKQEGRVPAEWRTLSFNPNLCLVIVKPRFVFDRQR